MRKTFVDVDGFNLYYGAVKGTPYKWLNLEALFRLLLPQNQVVAIKYFTARVKPRPNDPNSPARQNAYLRALATIHCMSIYYGSFVSHQTMLPEATSTGMLTGKFSSVLRTEEKGSDVNLAAHLLADAYEGLFDVAAVVTGDSDLLTPVDMARTRCRKIVGVLNPQRRASRQLGAVASFYKAIRSSALARSQFPAVLHDAVGTIHKPVGW